MSKICLGVDWGEVRVGVAISDELGMFAHPLETIEVKRTDVFGRIAQLVRERGVGEVVVGVPRNMDGSYGASAEKAREFAQKLQGRLGEVKVHLVDERWSSRSAERAFRETGRNSRKQRAVIDQAAAQTILQTWLDRRSNAAGLL